MFGPQSLGTGSSNDEGDDSPEIATLRRRISYLPTPTSAQPRRLPMTTEGFPPFISAQLNYLIHHFPLPLKMEQAWSGSKNYPAIFDRFTLCVPYCLDYIKWDVIYNAEFPLCPPDFVFGAEDENFRPTRVMTTIYGGDKGQEWNYKDPAKLCSLIQELRDEYTLYQRRKVGEVDDDRLKFEISTILSREGIEMRLTTGLDKIEEVKFSVPLLDININRMVPGCPWRHLQKIHLQVVYPISRKYSLIPSKPRLKLVSTPELKALFSVDDVKLPSWVDGMCMAEYLPHLEHTLQGQIIEAVSSVDARRQFIEGLGTVFGRPIEADPIFCRKATILTASGVFAFLVHFHIPAQFPKHQPALVLQSSQHFNLQGAPIQSSLITEYPWSPRWEPLQMAERIFDFLVDESLNFKRYCTES
ncbi:hypothetical protein MLD38_001824 [Melastoma candidum]|uniref:Uncharacterized protein n=1 Tax=Melastoma candidum TaxID=119954 RepID=A0ACB9SG45_9MYRT|nr:hypothetical protein MLD38_001824 [Melastoma candidum]